MSRKRKEEEPPVQITARPLDSTFDGFWRWVKIIVEDEEKSSYNSSYKDNPSNGYHIPDGVGTIPVWNGPGEQ